MYCLFSVYNLTDKCPDKPFSTSILNGYPGWNCCFSNGYLNSLSSSRNDSYYVNMSTIQTENIINIISLHFHYKISVHE